MIGRMGAALMVAVLATLSPAAAQTFEPGTLGDTAKGKVLVNAQGRTLYTFERDPVDKSNCNGPCEATWPPVYAFAGESRPVGGWTVINRDDGSKQWAYKRKPVYTYVNDKQAGDTNGDGVDGAWHVATP